MNNYREYTDEEFELAKNESLANLRSMDNRSKKTLTYGNDSFSADELIEHISSETDIGLDHIRMWINSISEDAKEYRYKRRLTQYLKSIPDQDRPCFYIDGKNLSPFDALIEVESDSELGQRWLNAYIQDCQNNCEPVYIEVLLPEDPIISLSSGTNYSLIMIAIILVILLLSSLVGFAWSISLWE